MFRIFSRKNKCNSDKVILKTPEEKLAEESLAKERRKCPTCGKDPFTGRLIVGFGSTDGEYNYVTCSHCNTDYKYK